MFWKRKNETNPFQNEVEIICKYIDNLVIPADEECVRKVLAFSLWHNFGSESHFGYYVPGSNGDLGTVSSLILFKNNRMTYEEDKTIFISFLYKGLIENYQNNQVYIEMTYREVGIPKRSVPDGIIVTKYK